MDQLEQRMEKSKFRTVYNANKSTAYEEEVLIGIGQTNHDGYKGLILNNKIEGLPSVTEYVMSRSEDTIQEWKARLGSFDELTIYMEDLSPDTCFSFLVLFARVSGISVNSKTFKEWLLYVNRWETGDVKTTGNPFESWGCLLSALGHEYIPIHEDDPIDENYFKEGLLACLRLTFQVLKAGMKPNQIKLLDDIEEYQRAIAILHNSEQEYKRLLGSAEKIQLNVPVRGSNKQVIVDAFLATENTHIGGVFKSFIRNDREETFLHSGFGLMGLHSPSAIGSGGDMVISVDPSVGIHLKDLWVALEQKETEAWDHELRPQDVPKFPQTSPYNEPWYDEMGRYTLVAAPKRIEKGAYAGELGSKLEWNDVLDVLWQTYHPLKHLKIYPIREDGTYDTCCFIEEHSPLTKGNNKAFIPLKWHSFGERQSFLMTPTIKRYLAACADSEITNPIQIKDLPPETSFDFMSVPGGFTVIHRNGVLFFDDWSKDDSAVEKYKTEYLSILKRYQDVKSRHEDITTLFLEVKAKLAEGNIRQKTLVDLNERLSKIKMEMRETILTTMATSQEYNILKFREKVEQRWGLERQLDELYQTVTEIEDIVKSYVETNTGDLINRITIFGFPIATAAAVLQIFPQQLFGNLTDHLAWIVVVGAGSGFAILRLKKKWE